MIIKVKRVPVRHFIVFYLRNVRDEDGKRSAKASNASNIKVS